MIELVLTSVGDDPLLQDALSGDKACDWHDAMEVELLQVNLVTAPPGTNIIPSGYAFCHKQNEEGKIVWYKARLTAKGYRQQFLVLITWIHMHQHFVH